MRQHDAVIGKQLPDVPIGVVKEDELLEYVRVGDLGSIDQAREIRIMESNFTGEVGYDAWLWLQERR